MKRVLSCVLVLVALGALPQAQTLTADQIKAFQTAVDQLSTLVKALTPPPAPTTFYTAPTDTIAHPRPAPLALGSAGFRFVDPTFGSAMLRVTDASTNSGSSLRVASNAHLPIWNATSTRFYVVGEGGECVVFGFDGVTATKLAIAVPGSNVEPSFSYVDPDRLFIISGPNTRTLQTFSLATNARTGTVLDFDAAYPALALANTYIGAVVLADNDVWVATFGGFGQDDHRYVHHSKAGLLDTQKAAPKPFKVHSISMDRTGRYVLIYPTAVDLGAGVAQVQVWDTTTGILTPVTNLPGGHDSAGYGDWTNQDCCSNGTNWDAAQWQYRSLATPNVTTNLIPTVLLPKEVSWDDHSSWRHNAPGAHLPFISSTYRYGAGLTAPWRAWDDEVIAVSTDGSGVVWRFAHHQSLPEGDFWSQPIVNVDPSGRYALFTSNWGKTLGTSHAAPRQDVFLVTLR